MKLPRNVSGEEFARHLEKRWQYTRVRQKGSHIRLTTVDPTQHHLSVPNHYPLKTGTLLVLVKSVADQKGVDRDDVLNGL